MTTEGCAVCQTKHPNKNFRSHSVLIWMLEHVMDYGVTVDGCIVQLIKNCFQLPLALRPKRMQKSQQPQAANAKLLNEKPVARQSLPSKLKKRASLPPWSKHRQQLLSQVRYAMTPAQETPQATSKTPSKLLACA